MLQYFEVIVIKKKTLNEKHGFCTTLNICSSLPVGGLWHASLIDKNLVDFFVPFLPLEYHHVIDCAMAEMKARGHRPDKVVADKVARDLVYFPKSERVFSVKGCKTIQSKLDYYT